MGVDSMLYTVQWIGVFAFTVSATIYAVKKNTDVVGALIFSFFTSFGGGFMRDLILGYHPPHVLFDKQLLWLALFCAAVSLICFHMFFIPCLRDYILSHEHAPWIDLLDAIGLAAFCISGVDVAAASAGSSNALLLIFSGCITGFGGGVLRDVCSAELPIIFRKHVYILPTVVGATLYVLTYHAFPLLGHVLSMMVSIAVIVLIRTLAIFLHWNLPTPLRTKK